MGLFKYALAWLLFAMVHSLLARPLIQQRIENYLGCSYRLIYNLLALVSISAVFVAGRHWISGSTISIFHNSVVLVISQLIQLSGVVVFLIALAYYDIGRFAGITQLFTGEKISASANEPLQRRGLNLYVRHPLYTGAFMLLWGGAVSPLDIWTAIWGTVYFLIGTFFEERKLINIYGDDYRRYMAEVPRYFPG